MGSKAERLLAERLVEPREEARQAANKSQVVRAASRTASREFLLGIGSVGSGVGLLHDVLGGEALEARLVKTAEDAVVVAALMACSRGFSTWWRERRLPPEQRTDPRRLAAYRHLCVLSPPLESGA